MSTPSIEYFDVFDGKSGLIDKENMFKFFDDEGRTLVLRPDITTPIARLVATKYNDKLPLKLSYTQNAFRNDETYKGAKQNEFTQVGVELIGVNSVNADAEVILMTILSLLSAGLSNFQIEIGQVMFFKGII